MIGETANINVAHKLEQLALLYRKDRPSETMAKTLKKLFGYEAETCRSQLRQLRGDLSDFETKYQMASDEFFQRFQKGQTDDNMDFVEWASIVQMARRLEQRLTLLNEE